MKRKSAIVGDLGILHIKAANITLPSLIKERPCIKTEQMLKFTEKSDKSFFRGLNNEKKGYK